MNVIRSAAGCMALACAAGFALSHPAEVLALARQSGLIIADPKPAAVAIPAVPMPQAPAPAPAATSGISVALDPDPAGQYHADIDVEGQHLSVLVDTGASIVALSYEAAARLGYYPAPADFTIPLQTANGLTRGARIRLREIHLGPLVARNVEAIVSRRGALSTEALLGMSFLRQLGGVTISDGRLVLSQ